MLLTYLLTYHLLYRHRSRIEVTNNRYIGACVRHWPGVNKRLDTSPLSVWRKRLINHPNFSDETTSDRTRLSSTSLDSLVLLLSVLDYHRRLGNIWLPPTCRSPKVGLLETGGISSSRWLHLHLSTRHLRPCRTPNKPLQSGNTYSQYVLSKQFDIECLTKVKGVDLSVLGTPHDGPQLTTSTVRSTSLLSAPLG